MNDWPGYDNDNNLNESQIIPAGSPTISQVVPPISSLSLNLNTNGQTMSNSILPSNIQVLSTTQVLSTLSQSSNDSASNYRPQTYDRQPMKPTLASTTTIPPQNLQPQQFPYSYDYNQDQDSAFQSYPEYNIQDLPWEPRQDMVGLTGSGVPINDPLDEKVPKAPGSSRRASTKPTKSDHKSTTKSLAGGTKPLAKRSRMGCLTCRSRKKRCCETRPKCTECGRLKFNCVWPEPGTEHKNKLKDVKQDANTIDHEIYGKIKVLRGIVEYRSDS